MKNNLKDIKIRLYNFSNLIAEKNELELRSEQLNEDVGLSGMSYDNEVKSYGISKTTEQQAVQLAEHQEKLNKFIKHKGIEVRRIENAFTVLTEKEKKIVELKYIKRLSDETISYTLDRSCRSCRRLEYEALIKMDNIINYKMS